MALTESRLCHAPWFFDAGISSRGVVHGFVGKPLNFSATGRESSAGKLFAELAASELVLVHQVHGARLAELSEIRGAVEADGIIFPLCTPGRRVVVGVRSADCVPIILIGQDFGAVVHAGWRGLAAGIVAKAAQQISQLGQGGVQALIGPCAGRSLYEVGPEVLDAIGDTACAAAAADGKFLLDLSSTTQKQLVAAGVLDIATANLCTMADKRFYSFRREGAPVGNNLAFVVTLATDCPGN